ncbi:hypothetical protein So717_30020 [Roseobacter cerasinus]|uniref:Uncharacterized protein n=1 Tax=Roseobacter cerasinus TaxID=2602289 RepID=A0A640VT84_9RHOB|nr:hypothetical protein [Roseobacter cerasinus]GFE51249.1 hypothetical protein So717_30020 [Roseobacter cerasinus]
MRAIIRVSITGDSGSTLRNKLAGIADNYDFRTGPGGSSTGTWQNSNISESDFAKFQAKYWDAIASHPGPGTLDNLWCTIDTWPHPENHDDNMEKKLIELGLIPGDEK